MWGKRFGKLLHQDAIAPPYEITYDFVAICICLLGVFYEIISANANDYEHILSNKDKKTSDSAVVLRLRIGETEGKGGQAPCTLKKGSWSS
ncbi:hypothetical protein BC8716_08610 [Shouchella clausii]|nr:hypothetical protein BC8716_08610 [Shouchella clausii]PTL21221.1 hypothetical protein DA802_19205 [Shouchella clausii]QNM42362.1 hypothetical protein DUT88_05460 [Shouchella clausii]